MSGRDRSVGMGPHASFNHLRLRMTHENTPPEAEFERLASLRRRTALSRTAALLRELVKNIGKN